MPSFLASLDHCDQMGDVGMHVAIGQQTHEVQLSIVFLHIVNRSFLPGIRLL
jgi:hypothetical protein